LIDYRADKRKKDFMRETPLDVIGKAKSSRGILSLLEDEPSEEGKA
jgi:hypothetical protein